MKQLLEPQTYKAVLLTLWIVSVPMAVKDSLGIIPGLCAGIAATAIALGLAYITLNKSYKTKLLVLLGSVAVIVSLIGIFVKQEASGSSTATIVQVE
ncbi:hypothetical protein [Hymenobacter jejuensis]|uniref:Uncharacterized protein n=1 Tax=Hymenobacter jejuensis TaxID=2502781 RepID=A0A5B8A294_9BACT|nr:hypothetical protein [Hymenobacter jejuensis]QDA61511.1 hypothetical protein FHG12_16020 [Hymenobacter jejuensis]